MTTKPMHPRKRVAKIVRDCQQFIRDVEWWNTNRTDARPVDCEVEKVILSNAIPALAAWDAGDMDGFDMLTKRMIEYAGQEMRADEA